MPSFICFIYNGLLYAVTIFCPLLLKMTRLYGLNSCFYDNCDQNDNNKRKRRKKARKKKRVRRDSNLGPLSQHSGFTTSSHLDLACSAGVFLTRKEGRKWGESKGAGQGARRKKRKRLPEIHCENEKHLLIIVLDLCSGNEKSTNQHRRTIVPEAPFTSDKIKINTSLVYIMQAASCLREGEYCLIPVLVIIVGYVPSSLGKQGHSSSVFFLPSPSPSSFFRPSTYP